MSSDELTASKIRGAVAIAMRSMRTILEVSAADNSQRIAVLTRPYQESLCAQICADLDLPHKPHPWVESAVPAHQRKGRGSVCKKTPR